MSDESEPSASPAAAVIADLAARYWDAYCARNPVSATANGDHRHDHEIDDLRPEVTAAYRATLACLLDEVRAAAAEAETQPGVADQDRVTTAALLAQIEADLDTIDADIPAWTADPIEGWQVEIFNIESFQPCDTPEQAERLLARWHAIPWLLDQNLLNVRTALREGRVAAHAPAARVIAGLAELLEQPDEAWALLKPAQVDHPDWPAAALAPFRDALRDTVAHEIRPALGRMHAGVREDILPATRSDERPGMASLPAGSEAYRRLVRVETSLDAEPDELHRIGLEEVARINSELEELGQRVLGTRVLAEIRAKLRGDPALHFQTADEVADRAAEALARAKAAIPGWFGVLPHADCVVVRMGDHEARHGTIAYYRNPAPDGSRPGQYYVNTSEPTTRPRYEAEALAYHESIPGHHLQIAIAQEVPGLPAFRRQLGVTAFWEGWGLYAERLADEMGLYSADLDRIGILSFDAWRACRLVVDTGMHAFGWSRQRAIDFMTENTALAENNIANEVDRYIVWPAQALAYKAGQLELLRLRAMVRNRLGAQFDIRAFHDAVLQNGAIGLGPLGRLVEARLLGD
jgi:uncharacterized protein (DUF885 family)